MEPTAIGSLNPFGVPNVGSTKNRPRYVVFGFAFLGSP
jgi:hypothetical protein